MSVNDIKAHHILAVAGAIVLLGAWRVKAALQDAFQKGTLNPGSTENIVYKTASTPFSGSLGVWLYEKLNPRAAEGATARTNRQLEQARASKRSRAAATVPAGVQSTTPAVKLPPVNRGATGTW
jgi:hypothetical protein